MTPADRVTRRALVVGLMLALGACDTMQPPPAPGLDGSIRRDGGSVDANVARRDSGVRRPPAVDGLVDAAEWRGAAYAEVEHPTDRPGSTLSGLRAIVVDARLFVAVEGTLAPGDAFAVYVDRDLGTSEGVEPRALADTDGALDVALTQPGLAVPTDFRMDFAWGTNQLPHTAVGLDEAAGWRDVANQPDRFGWVAAEEAPTVCSDVACETGIALARLGGRTPRTIALFARIVRAEGGLTNQTLPADDASRPERVGVLLTLEEGTPDAGVPDAGADAGPPPPDGIVIDGVIGPDEWAAATVQRNTVPAAGTFSGSALTTLRALRDGTRLYVAIEATLGANQAIAMYVDRDLGGADGLVSPTPLEDLVGALDTALSKELFTPADVRIDFAWGTVQMNRVASGLDDRMGWRDVGTMPDAFRAIDASRAPSACRADACETSIELSALGARPGEEIALFVRLVSASSVAFSNQTLPMDDPSAPELISVFLRLP